jgi:ATP-dependent DNA helicase RecQ
MEQPEESPDPLKEALKILFSMDYLFPYQRLVISNILEAAEARGFSIKWPPMPGLDDEQEQAEQKKTDQDEIYQIENESEALGRQIVILPTGAGKSLCFQLPAMLLEGPTLVIYPILSLMADQERRLREKGFAPVLLRGGQSAEEREVIWESLRQGKSRFIIANPEVLLSPKVMEKLSSLGLIHLVIDEAHCVSEWGESFRPDYLRIGEIINATKGENGGGRGPIVTAFTATASAEVLEKIEKYVFSDEGAQKIIGNPDRSNISYSAWGVLLRDIAVRDFLVANERPAIVFCSSRPGVEKLARYLRNSFNDREIKFYHAGLSREEKTAVEKWFFPNPQGVLVSTCAYGMGVDKADIRTVIHRDCPPSVEAYLQESGRAGRDGKASRAILLWGPDDEKKLHRAGPGRKRLEDLLNYARNRTDCRREVLLNLLNYEGPKDNPGTSCCDVCQGKVSQFFREEPAIKNFIKRNSRFYTVYEAEKVLARAENLKLSEQEAGELLRILLELRIIRKSANPLWKNRLK